MDLATFLKERLDDDERFARAVFNPCFFPDSARWVAGDSNAAGVRAEDGTPVTRHSWPAEMDHIARHDPARVLADVAAKRRVLELLELGEQELAHVRRTAPDYALVRNAEKPRNALLLAVQALALPYADHPAYDESWRP